MVSKNGNPWSSFTIEDYDSSYEFRIFKEEYLKFKHFLFLQNFLHVKINFKKNFYTDDVKVSFVDMKLLSEVLDRHCEKLTLKLSLEVLNEQTILDLDSILKNHKGKQSVKFLVRDSKSKTEVLLPSRNTKVNVTSGLLDLLEKQQINFKLN